jgi:PLP dependent protein
MSGVEEALARVRERIAAACERAGRPVEEVRLVGATKGVPATVVAEALDAGLQDFGENRARDLEAKSIAVPAIWHYLGKLQSGTARKVADRAHVVHSAERGGGLAAVARRADAGGREVPCLAQVDFTGRRQGVAPEELGAFLQEAAALRGVRIRGLMTVPPFTDDPEGARSYFRMLRTLRDDLSEKWPDLRELSMGMSADFEIGVEEGATMVRVGTALFGHGL